jgi:type I restriction enzyme, S subunit
VSSFRKLPTSWEKITFNESVDVVSDGGVRIKQKDYLPNGETPVIDQGDGLIGGYTDQESARISNSLPLIIFGDHTRRLKFVKFPFAVGADGVKIFNPIELWDKRFLFLQLGTVDLEDRGYGRHYQHLRKVVLALPPKREQTRIVEKLEELLSDLDAGVAELKAAQKKLAQYRQSLLKAAVEGTLTAEWRKHNSPQETGAQLLERILKERRARWETKQLAKFAEQGKIPPKGWQDKYVEPVRPDTRQLSELPDGWIWATLDQLTEFITSGSRGWAEYYASEGATFIRSQNINKDRLDLTDIAFVNPPRSSEGARTLVQLDDLLLTITGANVGKSALVEKVLGEAYVSQHVALIRPVETALSRYMHLYLMAGAGGRGQLNKEAYGAGKPGLNLEQVASVSIPLPCEEEVVLLLNELAGHLDAEARQRNAIANALSQSAAQRKNILKAAFSGQLVPQDPNDEPASVLLERIRAERAARDKQSNARKTRAMKEAA